MNPKLTAVLARLCERLGLGNLTKRLTTEIPPEDPAWQSLCERISEADLDDRSRWSEPINDDPLAAFTRALND
jgi:hypothetical protein